MVAIRKTSLVDGTNMQILVPSYYNDCDSTWGLPLYSVHRQDLHTQLKLLATRKEGPGRPCDVQVRSKIVEYVSKRARDCRIGRDWDTTNPHAPGRRERPSHDG